MSMVAFPTTSFIDEFLSDSELNEFLDIDELTDDVLASGRIPAAYRTDSLRVRLKKDIRAHLKRKTDRNGFPLWHSITEEDSLSTKPVTRYKQLQFFDPEDYVRVWKYWNRVEKKARWMKQGLEKRYEAKFDGEKLIQHKLFADDEIQEVASLKPSELKEGPETPRQSVTEGLRSKKPR